jgi:hypothetical protein
MKNLSYITLFFIIFLVSGCFNKITESAPPPPPKVYPKEANFLEEMGLGDTVHFFIKESGYFNPDRNSSYKTHLTCYTKLEILRADTFLYLSRLYFSVPGGLGQLGPNLEFDSVPFNFEVITKTFDSMELFCHYESNYSAYAFGDSCLIREFDLTGYPREFVLKRWKHFCSLGMSDSVYNEWRFNPPTHEQLTQWRKSMFMNESKSVKRFEVLSFYKDTCKISYSNELPITFPYDFSRLR